MSPSRATLSLAHDVGERQCQGAPTEDDKLRFRKLHPLTVDPAKSLPTFIEQAGYQVRKYHDDLEQVLDTLVNMKVFSSPEKFLSAWTTLLYGVPQCFLVFKQHLGLTLNNESHYNLMKQIIRLAHFKQYPRQNVSHLSDRQIVAALEGVIPSTVDTKPLISTGLTPLSIEVIKAGFSAKYRQSDLIVLPNLTLLRSFAAQWAKKNIQGALHVDHRTINVVAEFFSHLKLQDLNPEEKLRLWNEYNAKMDHTENGDEFSSDVKNKMKALLDCSSAESVALLSEAVSKANQKLDFIQNKQLKVLLAINDARNLLKPTDETHNISYFRLLRRALSQFPPSCGFFAVFTNTTSKVANFSPLLARDPSLKLLDHGRELFPPIYKIGTLDLMVKPVPRSWNELTSPVRLLSYGSPYYGLYSEEASRTMADAAITDILLTAQTKLLCQKFTPSPADITEAQIFALLGSTIQTRHTSSDLNSELVSSHAAHCMFINPSRDVIAS
ncbi:hypothetical protein PCANC_21725 [Puccinia coronata f. sp. avenae]|uniref:Uncharacterized protein n=1 Tax=Puccinia coronata f. sp. avenae TaxID=200324 RepID=A0A2N5S4M4_9BASI|nr:hypothetical protein PCANC_21725 [Puccinia coronata f. sp. avenae]